MNLYLSKSILFLKFVLIIVIMSSFDIWGYLGHAIPAWYRWCSENKLYACMMVFFVGNMLEAQVHRNVVIYREHEHVMWFVGTRELRLTRSISSKVESYYVTQTSETGLCMNVGDWKISLKFEYRHRLVPSGDIAEEEINFRWVLLHCNKNVLRNGGSGAVANPTGNHSM